jgi:hypothetical protein
MVDSKKIKKNKNKKQKIKSKSQKRKKQDGELLMASVLLLRGTARDKSCCCYCRPLERGGQRVEDTEHRPVSLE